MLSKKYYIEFAEIIAKNWQQCNNGNFLKNFITFLKSDNPRFSEDKFLAYCVKKVTQQ